MLGMAAVVCCTAHSSAGCFTAHGATQSPARQWQNLFKGSQQLLAPDRLAQIVRRVQKVSMLQLAGKWRLSLAHDRDSEIDPTMTYHTVMREQRVSSII